MKLNAALSVSGLLIALQASQVSALPITPDMANQARSLSRTPLDINGQLSKRVSTQNSQGGQHPSPAQQPTAGAGSAQRGPHAPRGTTTSQELQMDYWDDALNKEQEERAKEEEKAAADKKTQNIQNWVDGTGADPPTDREASGPPTLPNDFAEGLN